MLSRVKLNRSSVGWFWFWAAALLVLPNCFLDRRGIVSETNLHRGDTPWGSVIFCDIERPVPRRCAAPEDMAGGIRLKSAALALVAGATTTIGGLDDSPDVTGCATGQPQVVEFFGPFPQGSPVCLNCVDAIGPGPLQHASNADVCIARCLDLFDPDDANVPPSAEAVAWCTPERARLSTNFPISGSCTDLACNTMGALRADFEDQRERPEPVSWTNIDGVMTGFGSLTRIAPYTGLSDAGASSFDLIASGDAYFEFTATETTTARTAGLSSGPPPLGGIEFGDIGFGLLLMTAPVQILALENGLTVATYPEFPAGQRFRLKLRDNQNGTANVSFATVGPGCEDGIECFETVFHESDNTIAYPVRIDAMFREQFGTLTDIGLVRIR